LRAGFFLQLQQTLGLELARILEIPQGRICDWSEPKRGRRNEEPPKQTGNQATEPFPEVVFLCLPNVDAPLAYAPY
jgi:hypothetical protein